MPDNGMTAGHLRVRASWRNGMAQIESVLLKRPPIARLLTGLSAAEATKRISMFYSLCRHAQTRAAKRALAAARGEKRRAYSEMADAALWREMLHEQLWRLCLDWPRALGCPPETQAAARQAFALWRRQQKRAFFARRSAALLKFLESCLSENTLPSQIPNALRKAADDALAGWREKHPYPETFSSDPAEEGVGEAHVYGARGWLTHWVRLDAAGNVAEYRVIAPTDRKFADSDALTALLRTGASYGETEAKLLLEQAVLTLDPCVPYTLEWTKKKEETSA
ncbi:MAG: hypothetical protein LBG69_05620 [Zoogloeaceae bacterium]|jgi:hypothetical protein|nr:hypothetical protein [Zoogloeaceae bacterium]